MNCVTGYEALALNSVAVVTAGSSLWARLTTPVPREVTRRRVHAENAALMRRFGLDPEAVLGPAPDPVPTAVADESAAVPDERRKVLVSA